MIVIGLPTPAKILEESWPWVVDEIYSTICVLPVEWILYHTNKLLDTP